MTDAFRRVLVIRLSALGDIVHTVPIAAALRQARPGVEIDWLVSSRHREMLDLVTCVNRTIVVHDGRDARDLGSLAATIREIRARRYDVVIDAQGLIKSAALARASGARRIIGFSRSYLREPFARFFYRELHDPGGAGLYARAEQRHVVRLNLGLLSRLGIVPGHPEFPIRDTRSAVADQLRLEAGGRFAIVNAGAAWPNKRWPPARFGAMARAIKDRANLRSVVVWGPGERQVAEQVVADSHGAALLAPQTTLADLVALARTAAVMISGDTGPTHLAAAVGTPLVGIYGPTRPSRNGPWSPLDISVSQAESCSCIHLRRCTASRWCLLDIGVDEVVEAVQQRLMVGGRARA